jgi:hypothetical protein
MVISLTALFVALSGVGWAALQLPADSVGTAQLKKQAVTGSKIKNRAVGKRQINVDQVQATVTGTCSNSAIAAVRPSGGVTCGSAPPAEFGASGGPATIGTSETQVVSKSLPAGFPYLIFAFPKVSVTGNGTPQQVTTTCTLDANGATVSQSSTTGFLAPATGTQGFVLPLVLAAPVSTSAAAATVSCSYTATVNPTGIAETASSGLNAIWTSSNN